MEEKDVICIYLHGDRRQTPGRDLTAREAAARQKELSHRLLEEAAGRYQEWKGVPCRKPESDGWRIRRAEHGKPFFAEYPEIHFSISHSGSCWGCAFSGQPVGLDIQLRRVSRTAPEKDGSGKEAEQEMGKDRDAERIRRISDRFFHPDEQEWLERGGDFFAVWAAKESYVKYTGEGMKRSFDGFAVAEKAGLLSSVKADGASGRLYHRQLSPFYSLCLCAERIEEVHFFHI